MELCSCALIYQFVQAAPEHRQVIIGQSIGKPYILLTRDILLEEIDKET